MISVIVPVFNIERYLSRCVESIISQSEKNIEIILVDDGSTDSSGKICDRFAEQDNRIRVIHKENGGLSSARNAGIEIAKGEWFAFVDGDDFVSEDMLATLLGIVTQHNADVACCKFDTFVNENEIVNDISLCTDQVVLMNNLEALEAYICVRDDVYMTPAVWDRLYSRELFSDIRFAEGRYCEDTDFSIKVLCKSKAVVYVDRVLYHYRILRSGSIMNTLDSKKLEDRIFLTESASDVLRTYDVELSNIYITNCCSELISLALKNKSIRINKQVNDFIIGNRKLINQAIGSKKLKRTTKMRIFAKSMLFSFYSVLRKNTDN